MKHGWSALLLVGLGTVGLPGCYVVSPYDPWPAYVPAYPPPAPAPPPPPPVGVPAPSSPAPGTPGQGTPATPGTLQGSTGSCQTVTVEGHYETRVRQGGQRETIWVPTHAEQVCP